MVRTEIRVAGFGGQGIALAARILSKAIAVYGGKNAVFTQSYGPESRGGASSANIVVDTEEIDFPYPLNPDIFVVMSKEAYDKNIDDIKEGAQVFYDTELVELDERAKRAGNIYGIQSTKIAESLGVKIAANIVMLGFVSSKIHEVIDKENLKKCVLEAVPARFVAKNDAAFEQGYAAGKEVN